MITNSCGNIPARTGKFPARVLVVDGEPLVRWSLATGLRLAGFDAVEASDAAEARTLAAQQPALDVVMLDVNLRDESPGQLLEEIHLMLPACQFLVLAVAGQTVDGPPWDGVRVLRKPYDLDDVTRVVADIAAHTR